jgi:hypothetical protein
VDSFLFLDDAPPHSVSKEVDQPLVPSTSTPQVPASSGSK